MAHAAPENAAPANDYVSVAELDRVPLRVALSPLPTAFTLIRDALQDGRRGTPSAWRKSVVARLRARDVSALAPLVDPAAGGWPPLLENAGGRRETFEAALERLLATPGAEVTTALDTDPDVYPHAPAWRPIRHDPDAWMRRYVDALRRGWAGLAPLWRQSLALLEHEEERLEAAAARGTPISLLVEEMLPRAVLADGGLRFLSPPGARGPRRLRVNDRGPLLMPIVATTKAGSIATPDDVLVAMAYPVPEVWRGFDDRAPPPASLGALLGSQRAAMLERLDQPLAAGQLAELLAMTPSGLSFHLRALEAAGLVRRERAGRHVLVHRTRRGTQLLALYQLP